MSKVNSTARPGTRIPCKLTKPEKPYPDFPPLAHATKRWAKKVLGKLHYFDPGDDADTALQNYSTRKTTFARGARREPKLAGW
jgi:hypothetical protein